MRPPSLTHTDDGGLLLAHMAPWFVSALLELPVLLDDDQPDAVKQRLYPDSSGDPEQSDEWKKFVHPELFALLASAREIVCKDLATLEPMDEELALGSWQLKIPKEHINGWISALNAARLTLASAHEIEEEDMDGTALLMANESDDGTNGSDAESEGDFDEDEPFDDDDESDDDEESVETVDERRLAILKIYLLGDLQAMIIEDQHPPPIGPQIPDSLPPDMG